MKFSRIGWIILSLVNCQTLARTSFREEEEASHIREHLDQDQRHVARARMLAESFASTNGCPKGHKKNWGTGACEECEAGTFQPNELSTSNKCFACTKPRWGSEPGAFQCSACDQLGPNAACVDEKSKNDGTHLSPLQDGNGPSLAGTGPVTTNPCGSGSTDLLCECDAGEKRATNDGGVSFFCTPCEAGTFLNFNAHTSNQCANCGTGSSSGPGAVQCTQCNPGTEAPNLGSTECTPCKPGFFAELSGTPQCLQCFPGSGTGPNDFGSITCPECVPGTFSTEREGICRKCNPGTIAPFEGTTQCLPCAPGSSEPSFGSTKRTCDLCPVGTFADSEGSTSCESCGIFEFNLQENSVDCEPCLAAGVFFGLKHMDQCVITWLILLVPLMSCFYCCFRRYRRDRSVTPNVIMVRDAKVDSSTMSRWRPQSYIPDRWKEKYHSSANSLKEKYRASTHTLKEKYRSSFRRGGDDSYRRDYPSSEYDDRSFSSSKNTRKVGPPSNYSDHRHQQASRYYRTSPPPL